METNQPVKKKKFLCLYVAWYIENVGIFEANDKDAARMAAAKIFNTTNTLAIKAYDLTELDDGWKYRY